MVNMASPNTKRQAEVIRAMGHPSRLIMLKAMHSGEVCVCDLQRLVGSDMSTVSKHLSVLKNAGLVADRKQGQQVFYSLRMPCLLNFMDCIDEVLRCQYQGVA